MSQTIKLNFEIPQGYYTQEKLNNYIKNSISNLLSNSSVTQDSDTTPSPRTLNKVFERALREGESLEAKWRD
jgi:hypothetical protein